MTYKPGQSGNPGGRSKADVGDIAALARQYGPHAIRTLVQCLGDPRQRVAAATALLDRGYGRPQQTTRVEGDVNVLHLLAARLVSQELEGEPIAATPVVRQVATLEAPDE